MATDESEAPVSMQVTVDRKGRSSSEYIEGAEISGNVAVTVHEAIRFAAIEAVLVCQSKVVYVDILGSVDLLPEAETGTLVHLFDKVTLKESEGESEELAPGSYDFPYSFTVAKGDLPSTFTSPGLEGSGVTYYVEGLIIQDRNATEALARQFTYFPYIGTVDICSPKLLKPYMKFSKRSVGLLCFASNPVSLTLQLNRRGYCLGEKIDLNATVRNGSGSDVKLIVKLEETIKHDVRKPLHRHRKTWDAKVVSEQSSDDISPGSTFNSNLELTIPENEPVSLMMPVNILQVHYVLNVRVDVPHAIDIVVEIPITIGSKNSRDTT